MIANRQSGIVCQSCTLRNGQPLFSSSGCIIPASTKRSGHFLAGEAGRTTTAVSADEGVDEVTDLVINI